jgi:hypothetical protein
VAELAAQDVEANAARERELGVISLAPILDRCPGTAGDRAKLRELAASGVRLSRIYDRTTELLADPESNGVSAPWSSPCTRGLS